MVLLSSGAFIGLEMVLGYFICFLVLRHFPKWVPKTLLGYWAARYRKKCPILQPWCNYEQKQEQWSVIAIDI